MKRITFSRNPAVWIGLISAVLIAVVQSGISPELSANAAGESVLIALLAGIATRFFVTPTSLIPPASTPPPAA